MSVAAPAAGPMAAPDDAQVVQVTLPPEGQLAKAWEANALVRQQLRDEQRLLSWPSKATTGVASQRALILNRVPVMVAVSEWAAVCNEPKSVPIDWIREEACGVYRCLHVFMLMVGSYSGNKRSPMEGQDLAQHVCERAGPGGPLC